jgi:two-component system, NtrC family, sensor kinase
VTTFIVLAASGLLVGLVTGALLGGRRAARASESELSRSRAEISRRLADVFALQELSYALSESLQPRRIAEQVIGYLGRFTDVEGAAVALTSERGGATRVAAASGVLATLRDQDIPETDEGLLMTSLGREQMAQADDADGTRPTVAGGVTTRQVVVFPLRAHGVTVGALAAADPRRGTFDQQTLRLLSTVATHAAIVLSNARFFDLVRSGRDQWETTFNALTEGLAVVDAHDGIRRANRALAALVGRSVASLSGRPLPEVLLTGSADLPRLLDAARRGETVPPLTLRTAARRVLRVGAAPMRGEGETQWAVVLVEDITERERLESQLIQSEKMAAVGQLVSGVAHELNNPLTSITGLAEFLLEQPAPGPRDKDHLQVIRDQAERARRIVRNLLTFARQGPADVEAFSLNALVEPTVALVSYEMKLREIHLELSLDPALPLIVGDRHQIQQVVLNLVTNAIHAVQQNPPDRARRVAIASGTEGGLLWLRVTDSGPGIPDDLAPQIFTPFFTTKDPGQGTGLGLSISYRILEGHGGGLAFEPAPGGGAVFTMRLPAGSPDAVAAAAPAAEPEPGGPAARSVLVVDEDPAVRRMLAVLLTGSAAEVDAAVDAHQATVLLRSRSYDLVIADARTPVSAGERFADYLLREWPALGTRTIFLTADVRPDTEAWLRGLGCPVFHKPFRVAELKNAIANLAAGVPARGSVSAARPSEHGVEARG